MKSLKALKKHLVKCLPLTTQNLNNKGPGSFPRALINVFYIPSLGKLNFTMVIAMTLVGVMKVTIYKVIDVVAMGHSLMSAIGAVFVGSFVCIAGMPFGAVCRVVGIHGQGVFFNF